MLGAVRRSSICDRSCPVRADFETVAGGLRECHAADLPWADNPPASPVARVGVRSATAAEISIEPNGTPSSALIGIDGAARP